MSDSESGEGVENLHTKAVKPDLLDFLFTFALTLGLAPEFIGDEFSGLLSVNWTMQIRLFPNNPLFVFDLLVFTLGVITLTFSWYGFNSSISNRPVLYGSLVGLIRFFLDAFLVVLYGFVLVQWQKFEIVFITLIWIYWLYAFWDLLKLFEYRDDPWSSNGTGTDHRGRKLLRELIEKKSLVYAALFLAIGILYFFVASDGLVADYVTLLALILLSVSYRYQKAKGQWRPRTEVVREIEEAYD